MRVDDVELVGVIEDARHRGEEIREVVAPEALRTEGLGHRDDVPAGTSESPLAKVVTS